MTQSGHRREIGDECSPRTKSQSSLLVVLLKTQKPAVALGNGSANANLPAVLTLQTATKVPDARSGPNNGTRLLYFPVCVWRHRGYSGTAAKMTTTTTNRNYFDRIRLALHRRVAQGIYR